jgi:ATP-dependent Clp protease ATP-binding subunit ClpB
MRRAIQRLIQDPLALRLISGDFLEGSTIVADASPDGSLVFSSVGQASGLPAEVTQ